MYLQLNFLCHPKECLLRSQKMCVQLWIVIIEILEEFSLKFFFNFYLFVIVTHRERENEAETQAEGEAGSMQGARCGTRSRVSRITLKAEGGAKPLSHLGCLEALFF